MKCVKLEEAESLAEFGGKAGQLARALAAGLPVPGGFALDVQMTDAVANGRETVEVGAGWWAVRSSAVGEDSDGASFAGQHQSILHVTATGIGEAVRAVWRSAHGEGARAYREKLGLSGEPRMAVVLQQMVDARVAGVLFTKNPVTGADERIVEAAWGLGEVVVAGLVTPDSYRIARDGRVLERTCGYKDVTIERAPDGGTREAAVPPAEVEALCLGDAALGALHQLACRVEQHFVEGPHDLEFAFDGAGDLFLLQRRRVTR